MNFPQKLLEEEISQITERYKSTSERVHEVFVEVFSNKQTLLAKINESYPEEDVTRWSEYKSAIKEIRKRIYYELRQYHQNPDIERDLAQKLADIANTDASIAETSDIIRELLPHHISTKERVPYLPLFYSQISNLIDTPRTVLDLGCGIHPLSYPIHISDDPERYLAIDRDIAAIELLQEFGKLWSPLQAIQKNLEDVIWESVGLPDLVLMLKLIPVINRNQRNLLDHLAQCPGKTILITGSSTAMTKKKSIRQREDRILRQFVDITKRTIIGKIEIPSEFGYLIS